MIFRGTRRLLPVLMAVAAVGAGPAAAGDQGVVSPAQQARAGIAVAALRPVSAPPTLPALGSVLDPAPLLALSGQIAALDAGISGSESKVVLEKQQMAQASALYSHGQIISQADYQKAAQELAASQSALAVAKARRQSLLQQTQASWGPTVAGILQSGLAPLPQLAAHTRMLVTLSLPPGKTLAEPPREVQAEAQGIRFSATLIAPVPKMLGGFPGQALLYEAAAQPGIPIGATVSAALPAGPMRTGVLVPWSAVLWRDGRAIVFRAAAEGRFEPVPIATDIATDGGYLVSEPLARGNRIVVHGAALLLGGTTPPAAGQADEDDD